MITVNGQSRELPAQGSLVELIDDLVKAPGGRGVAVAVNGAVVPRAAWATTRLVAGDRVEVLTATQGG